MRKPVALLACFVLLWSSSACTRLKVHPVDDTLLENRETEAAQPIPATERAGVTFSAFRTAADQRLESRFEGEVLTQLWLLRSGRRELVHRAYDPSWSRIDLVPGDYELEVVEIYEKDRSYEPNQDNLIEFTVLPDTTVQVNLVVKQVPWGAVAVVTVAAILVVGLIVYAIVADDAPDFGNLKLRGDFELRRVQIRVPSHVRLPRIHWHGVLSYYDPLDFPIDVFFDGLEPPVVWDAPLPPEEATAPYLSAIGLPSPRDPSGEILLSFNRPMEPFYMGPDTIQLIRDDGQVVAGGVYYDDVHFQTHFHPLRPLACARYKLIVLGGLLYDVEGTPIAGNYEHTFDFCQEADAQ